MLKQTLILNSLSKLKARGESLYALEKSLENQLKNCVHFSRTTAENLRRASYLEKLEHSEITVFSILSKNHYTLVYTITSTFTTFIRIVKSVAVCQVTGEQTH